MSKTIKKTALDTLKKDEVNEAFEQLKRDYDNLLKEHQDLEEDYDDSKTLLYNTLAELEQANEKGSDLQDALDIIMPSHEIIRESLLQLNRYFILCNSDGSLVNANRVRLASFIEEVTEIMTPGITAVRQELLDNISLPTHLKKKEKLPKEEEVTLSINEKLPFPTAEDIEEEVKKNKEKEEEKKKN